MILYHIVHKQVASRYLTPANGSKNAFSSRNLKNFVLSVLFVSEYAQIALNAIIWKHPKIFCHPHLKTVKKKLSPFFQQLHPLAFSV